MLLTHDVHSEGEGVSVHLPVASYATERRAIDRQGRHTNVFINTKCQIRRIVVDLGWKAWNKTLTRRAFAIVLEELGTMTMA